MGLMRISGAARGDIMLKDIVPPGALLANRDGMLGCEPKGLSTAHQSTGDQISGDSSFSDLV